MKFIILKYTYVSFKMNNKKQIDVMLHHLISRSKILYVKFKYKWFIYNLRNEYLAHLKKIPWDENYFKIMSLLFYFLCGKNTMFKNYDSKFYIIFINKHIIYKVSLYILFIVLVLNSYYLLVTVIIVIIIIIIVRRS